MAKRSAWELNETEKVETIAAKPQMTKQIDSGFVYNIYREKTNFLGVLRYSVTEVRYWISTTVESLAMLIKGQFTVNDLSGPVGIIEVIGDSYEEAKTGGAVMVSMQMLVLGNFAVRKPGSYEPSSHSGSGRRQAGLFAY